MLGEEANKVRKVWIDDCRLVQNKRTGIAFQRAYEFVCVRSCHIESREPSTDASIDLEPSGTGAPTDVILDGPCTQSIAVNATSASDVSSISVRDKEIATENGGSWDAGIQIGGGKTVQHITVTGNAVGADVGVRFQGNSLQ
jgi:hypothetical protein